MPGSSSDVPIELRFKKSGWSFYGGLVVIAGAFTAIAALAWAAAAWSAWGGGHLGILSGLFIGLSYTIFGLLFTLAALFVWGLLAYGTAKMWRIWRQPRQPGVVVVTSGIRFEAKRGHITVPWAEVEHLILSHVTTEPKPISRLRLRVAPDAAIFRETHVHFPVHRWLTIALLPEETDVSLDEATRILQGLSESRLEVVDEQELT